MCVQGCVCAGVQGCACVCVCVSLIMHSLECTFGLINLSVLLLFCLFLYSSLRKPLKCARKLKKENDIAVLK